MKSNTRLVPRGQVELYVVLPLFIFFVFGIELVGRAFLHVNRTERFAWVYAMSRAHRAPERDSLRRAEQVLEDAKVIYKPSIENEPVSRKWSQGIWRIGERVLPQTLEIPIVFRFFLLKNPSHHPTAQVVDNGKFLEEEIPVPYRTELWLPGGDFSAHGALWKRMFGAWAMKDAGFDYWLLGPDAIAFYEIFQALPKGQSFDWLGSTLAGLSQGAAGLLTSELEAPLSRASDALFGDLLSLEVDRKLGVNLVRLSEALDDLESVEAYTHLEPQAADLYRRLVLPLLKGKEDTNAVANLPGVF